MGVRQTRDSLQASMRASSVHTAKANAGPFVILCHCPNGRGFDVSIKWKQAEHTIRHTLQDSRDVPKYVRDMTEFNVKTWYPYEPSKAATDE